MRLTKFIPVLLVFGIAGCNPPEPNPVTPPATPATDTADDHTDHDHEDHAGHDHGDPASVDTDSAMAKMMSGLKELSPEDQESAMAQHLCPVSGEMLGTMGAPEKVDVNGKSVWICCDGCKDKLLAEPDKYLAKLDE